MYGNVLRRSMSRMWEGVQAMMTAGGLMHITGVRHANRCSRCGGSEFAQIVPEPLGLAY